MKRSFTNLIAALALLVTLAIPLGMWGQTATLVSGSGTISYSIPEGWTTSGTVEGGSYLKFDNGTITSPAFAPHNGLSFTYSVATFGSGDNHPLTIRILNASTNAVIVEMTTATPTSSTYINTGSPLSLGDVTVAFKIQMYAPSGKGIRLRNYSVTGTPAGDTPTTYTVTFDAGDGTFVGNTDFPNTSNTKEAGTYTLPSASQDGYTFNGWAIGEDTYEGGASYTVSGDADFVASYTQNGGGTGGDEHWVLTPLADLTSDDVFVMVGMVGNNSYAMTNNNGTSTAPATAAVTIANNEITSTVAANIQWTVSGNATNGYTFYPNGSTSTWLYCNTTSSSSNNNNIRVGTGNRKVFELNSNNYLITNDTYTDRYLSIYNDADWRGYINTSNGVATMSFYKKVTGGVVPPSITANNVEIAYNATSGEITYALNNPATNGSLSVLENVDWISNAVLSTTESKVTFTTTANEATTPREGIITITYTYGDNETVSKDVTITQAAAPVIYNTMQAIFDKATEVGNTATNVNIALQNWVVSGVSTNGKNVFVTDGTKGFVIFDNGGNMGFAVGNILSGTVSCKVQLYNGFAEITQLNSSTEGISIATGGTVTAANIAMANLAGVNTGALLHYDNLTCSVTTNSSNNTIYNLSDGTTTLQVYNALYAFGSTLENDKTYNITGVYQQYNNTKEILPRSADDIEEVISAEPSVTVTPSTIDAPFTGAESTLTLAYENIEEFISFDFSFCDADGGELQEDPDWIDAEIQEENDTYSLYCLIDANDGAARTAYIKVYTYDDNLEEVYAIVTINQAQYVVDYAELPFEYDGNGTGDLPNGFTVSGLGTYNSSPAMKFDGTGDYAILKFNERPGTLTFDIKGNTFSGGTFTVQTSEDGVTYTDLETYTELGDTQHESFDNLGENVRYIKWIYTEKVSGNVALGNIALAEYAAPVLVASITVNPDEVELDAEEHDGTLDLTWENLEISDFFEDFAIQYYDAEGDEVSGPDWIMAVLAMQDPNEGEGYLVSYMIEENEGEARTAYFKVFADGGDDFVYSNLVTITQDAYVAPGTETTYALYEGALVEGDYIIYYDGYAMKNTVSNNRLSYEQVEPSINDVITTDDASIVWHIAQSGDYWTIYSADAKAYAASTGTKNQAQMLSDGTSDNALWTVTDTYEFENKARAASSSNPGNKWLRNNGTNGFACYSDQTGGALSLYKKVETPATETYYLTINGYGNSTTEGWNLIASPVSTTPEQVTNLIGQQISDDPVQYNYDLYLFDQTTANEWQNYHQHSSDFNIVPGTGYLYANKGNVNNNPNTVTLTFTGVPYDGNGEIELVYSESNTDSRMWGWNLVGNPFGVDAEIRYDYYMMNSDGSELIANENYIVEAMHGVFVKAESGEETVIFEPQSRARRNNNDNKVVLNISHNHGAIVDRAVVRFGEGRQLPKMQLFENSTKLYITQDNKDYAVVRAEAQGEMPVNFHANENGQYTLTVNPENVEMGYLHLIDNMTGADIDLIQTPSYTFSATTSDYTSRFRLVFSAQDSNDMGDDFAFISNGQIILTGDNSNATLQVVDMLGRVVSSQTVNGNSAQMAPVANGVYVLRLINGNDVKTQKIVVE